MQRVKLDFLLWRCPDTLTVPVARGVHEETHREHNSASHRLPVVGFVEGVLGGGGATEADDLRSVAPCFGGRVGRPEAGVGQGRIKFASWARRAMLQFMPLPERSPTARIAFPRLAAVFVLVLLD